MKPMSESSSEIRATLARAVANVIGAADPVPAVCR
jgi:hypothetical protein